MMNKTVRVTRECICGKKFTTLFGNWNEPCPDCKAENIREINTDLTKKGLSITTGRPMDSNELKMNFRKTP